MDQLRNPQDRQQVIKRRSYALAQDQPLLADTNVAATSRRSDRRPLNIIPEIRQSNLSPITERHIRDRRVRKNHLIINSEDINRAKSAQDIIPSQVNSQIPNRGPTPSDERTKASTTADKKLSLDIELAKDLQSKPNMYTDPSFVRETQRIYNSPRLASPSANNPQYAGGFKNFTVKTPKKVTEGDRNKDFIRSKSEEFPRFPGYSPPYKETHFDLEDKRQGEGANDVQDTFTGLLDIVKYADTLLSQSQKVNHRYYRPPEPATREPRFSKKNKINYPDYFDSSSYNERENMSQSLPQINHLTNNSDGSSLVREKERERSGSVSSSRIYQKYLARKNELSKSHGELENVKNSTWSSYKSSQSVSSLKSYPSEYLSYLEPTSEAINPAIRTRYDPPPSIPPSPIPCKISPPFNRNDPNRLHFGDSSSDEEELSIGRKDKAVDHLPGRSLSSADSRESQSGALQSNSVPHKTSICAPQLNESLDNSVCQRCACVQGDIQRTNTNNLPSICAKCRGKLDNNSGTYYDKENCDNEIVRNGNNLGVVNEAFDGDGCIDSFPQITEMSLKKISKNSKKVQLNNGEISDQAIGDDLQDMKLSQLQDTPASRIQGRRATKRPKQIHDPESSTVGKFERNASARKSISSKDLGMGLSIRTKSYKIRFYILGLFSLIAMMQCVIWGTWGPIIESSKFAFPSWTSGSISLFNAWGAIDCIVFIVPVSYLNQKYGLRVGILLSTLLMSVGTLLRCIPADELGFTILAHLCAIINGVAGCLTLSLPAMIAATWFPPTERTTATAVASLFCQMGGMVMYLEPLLVRAPPDLGENGCSSVSRDASRETRSVSRYTRQAIEDNESEILGSFFNGSESRDIRYSTEEFSLSPQDVRDDIMKLMYIYAGIAAFLFVAVLIYFPAAPKLPPSRSSAVERLDYFTSVKALFYNSQFMLLLITYIFSVGVPIVWVGIMNFNLCCIGVRQDEGMYIAITAVGLSCCTAFIAARVTDAIYGHLKMTIMILLSLSSLCFLWFLFNTLGVIPPTLAQIYISVGGAISLQYATVPLLIELAVELSYPCPESVVGALLTGAFNVISGIFLLLFLIPSQCYYWVNYVLVACTSLTLIPIFFVTETHRRMSDDCGEESAVTEEITDENETGTSIAV